MLTMGALHAGHSSLIDRSVSDCQDTIVTVFVNPTQFGANEDFGSYPRTAEADIRLVESRGAGMLFMPTVKEMYPTDTGTMITVPAYRDCFEGRTRPGHFDGVATVVAKFFSILNPTDAFFGQKDYQQVIVLKQMVADLFMSVSIQMCPTVREGSGVAMSSRNAYLSSDDFVRASAIYSALQSGVATVRGGERRCAEIKRSVVNSLSAHPYLHIDYVEAANAHTLSQPDEFGKNEPIVIMIAAWLGSTRLIDNVVC